MDRPRTRCRARHTSRRRWPSFRDVWALVAGALRVRGWTWLMSMLWVAAGAVITGQFFYATTLPWYPDLGIPGWAATPVPIQAVVALAFAAWLALLVPVPIAGFIRFRGWKRGCRLRAVAWVGAWIAGAALLCLAEAWGDSPGVSWGELPICAAWLVIGALMTWVLAVPPAARSDVPSTSSQDRGNASPPVSPFSRL